MLYMVQLPLFACVLAALINGSHAVADSWLQVEQQGDPMTITITGPKGSAEMCKQEITALINDPYPPGPGGEGEQN